MPQRPQPRRKRGRAQTFHSGLIPGSSLYKTDALPLSYGGNRTTMSVLKIMKRFGCAIAEHRDLKTFSSWPVGPMEKLASADGDSRFVVIATRKQDDLRRGPWGWGQIAKHGEQEACTGAVADGALAFGISYSGLAQYLKRWAHNPKVRGSKLRWAISSALNMSICLRRGCEHFCANEGPPRYTAHDQTRQSLLWDLNPRPPAY
jgi:hypothetical protein